MTIARILRGLEGDPSTGDQARRRARLGFLEWIFAAPGPVTVQMARVALDDPAAQAPKSAAARAFVACLRDMCLSSGGSPSRQGRARIMH